MKQLTLLFFTTTFLFFGNICIGQIKKDTTYIAFTGDSIVQKGDTMYIFNQNGCIEEKGTWDFKGNRWVGKYVRYYANNNNAYGRIRSEALYDKNGIPIWRKHYDENGKLIYEHTGSDK